MTRNAGVTRPRPERSRYRPRPGTVGGGRDLRCQCAISESRSGNRYRDIWSRYRFMPILIPISGHPDIAWPTVCNILPWGRYRVHWHWQYRNIPILLVWGHHVSISQGSRWTRKLERFKLMILDILSDRRVSPNRWGSSELNATFSIGFGNGSRLSRSLPAALVRDPQAGQRKSDVSDTIINRDRFNRI